MKSRDLHNNGMVRALQLHERRCAIALPFAHVPLCLSTIPGARPGGCDNYHVQQCLPSQVTETHTFFGL